MAVTKPDEYKNNNPNRAFVDSDFVRGGGRVVADLTSLYSLTPKIDQLKESVTLVYVKANSIAYLLIDIINVANSSGWEEQPTKTGLDGKLNVDGNISLSGEGNRLIQATPDGTPQAFMIPRNGFVTDTDIIAAIIAADYSTQNANYIAPANNKIFQAGTIYWEAGNTYLAWRDNFSVKVGGSSGGSSKITLNKTQANLINGGTMDEPNWYLPYLQNDGSAVPADVKPYYGEINGLKLDISNFNPAFTPPRIYGFDSNDTATIKILAI